MYTPDDGPKTPLSVFKNDHKKQDTHPDFTGELLLTDTIIRQVVALRSDGKTAVLGFAGWHKKTTAGKPFISGSVKVDTFRTAKRYDVEVPVIEGIMNNSAPAPEAAAPAAAANASADDDIFGGSEPTPEAAAPSADDDLGF